MYVAVDLCYGGSVLATGRSTAKPFAQAIRWCEHIRTNVKLSQIPRRCLLSFTLYLSPNKPHQVTFNRQTDIPISWYFDEYDDVMCRVNAPLIDYRGYLRQGEMTRFMWLDDVANPIGMPWNVLERNVHGMF